MKIERTMKVVKRHLERTFPGGFSEYVKDPLGLQGRQWELRELMSGAMAGAVSGARNCREVEMLTEQMGRRIPDTTLSDTLCQLSPRGLERMLVQQVHEAYKSKGLEVTAQWPFHLTVVDGKCINYAKSKGHRNAQRI